jgi:hypothetical protein
LTRIVTIGTVYFGHGNQGTRGKGGRRQGSAFACWYFRKTLFSSARNLFFRGIFPLLGGIAMALAFGISAKDMIQPDYGYTAFGSIGGVFVLGVGMLVLGIPLMLACFAFGTKRFFRGETLNADTEVKVPDVF